MTAPTAPARSASAVIVEAGDHRAPGRLGDLLEGAVQSIERPVVIEVIGLDIGDEQSPQVEALERPEGLIGLEHEEVGLPEMGAGSQSEHPSTDEEARIPAHRSQGGDRQPGARRLAVGTGEADRRHGVSHGIEQIRAPPYRYRPLPGGGQLGIVVGNRR